jgi:hypothetical protein
VEYTKKITKNKRLITWPNKPGWQARLMKAVIATRSALLINGGHLAGPYREPHGDE